MMKVRRALPKEVDQAKRRMPDMAGYVSQKTKEVGQEIESKAKRGGGHERREVFNSWSHILQLGKRKKDQERENGLRSEDVRD